jgi:hypothetical protein
MSLFVSFLQLVLKVKQQVDASCCCVFHGRFQGVLPKEHPDTFYQVSWGLYKGMSTNTHGQSDIVSHTTPISEIKNIVTAANRHLSKVSYLGYPLICALILLAWGCVLQIATQ